MPASNMTPLAPWMLAVVVTGALAGTVMPQLAKGYTDAELDAIARYFAATERP
jgi:cytochrome c553